MVNRLDICIRSFFRKNTYQEFHGGNSSSVLVEVEFTSKRAFPTAGSFIVASSKQWKPFVHGCGGSKRNSPMRCRSLNVRHLYTGGEPLPSDTVAGKNSLIPNLHDFYFLFE